MAGSNRTSKKALSLIHPDSAGVDIGSAAHCVAVPVDRAEQPVREFQSVTCELNRLVDWLEECKIKIVAMESTGVYWIPLYELLSSRGFEVLLVDTRQFKNVSGRKSDVLDCQWLQQLLSFGLLRGAFRPDDAVCPLRALVRLRSMLIRDQSRSVQHMQKALAQMNIQLANTISDIVGVTGQKILRAIVAGERDGQKLAEMRTAGIRASREEIAASLEGTWRAEHLFALKQALASYDFTGRQITECDQEIEKQLKALHKRADEPPGKRPSSNGNSPKFDAWSHLFKICCVDLTAVAGISVSTALTFVAEVGLDLGKRFPSAKHFASWLGLCPGTRISGGKRLSGKTRSSPNRLAYALRMAATALQKSKSSLGAFFRRLCARKGRAEAITATAHKLARLIYALVTKGQEYHDQGQNYFEEKYRERVVRSLADRARKLGMQLVPAEKDT